VAKLSEHIKRLGLRERPTRAALPEVETMSVLVTDTPPGQRSDRTVFDRVDLPVHRMGTPARAQLVGERPDHQFSVALTHRGWFWELGVDVVLHGRLRNRMVKRTRADLGVDRIWISRNSIYGDSGRACFPISSAPAQFEGRVWLATLDRDTIEEVSERSFDYGRSPSGTLEYNLHGGYAYRTGWRRRIDRRSYEYQTQWLRDNELFDEMVETVFPIPEATAARCFAARSGSYCDTDSI